MAKSFPNTGATVIDTVADLPAASAALEGVMMFQKDTNELKICDGSSWISMLDTDNAPMGAWTAFTPTVTQNVAVTFGANNSAYKIVGKTAFVRFFVAFNSSGTNAAAVYVTVPTAVSMSGAMSAYPMLGVGSLYNGSRYPFFVMRNGGAAQVLRFKPTNTTADDILFSGQIVSGNQMDFMAMWEIA